MFFPMIPIRAVIAEADWEAEDLAGAAALAADLAVLAAA